ncbi:hypothetical protein V5O48_002086 [Marasmius crinis-equi]|uniref:Proteophosphoglycan ppg4 n=1 Tax=Marasmius crinis-equi TaxID=585013 RepID=A0ABR3FWT7_9AGAR
MSGLPSRRHHRTSHFHDIFRSSSNNAPHEPQPGTSSKVLFPAETSDGQSEGDRAGAGAGVVESPKKRSTRIPLFGRSRKKSTHSVVAEGTSSRQSDVQSGRGSIATHSSRLHPDDQPVQARASSSQPSLPINTVQPTLGSKIVAHLTPRKSRKHKSSTQGPSGGVSDYASDTLSTSSITSIRPSVDSCSSHEGRKSSNGRRQSGSVTPRPAQSSNQLPQPTITVSQPDSYDLGEYDDLFTKPRQKVKAKPSPLQIPALAEKHRDRTRDSSASTESSTSSPNPPPDFGFSEPGNQSSATSTPTPETPTPTVDSSCFPSAEAGIMSASPSVAADPSKSHNAIEDDVITFNVRSKQPRTLPKDLPPRNIRVASDTEIYSGAEESDAMSVMSMPLLGSSSAPKRRRKTNYQTGLVTPLSYRPTDINKMGGRYIPPAPTSKPPTIPLPATPSTGLRPRAHTLLPVTSKTPETMNLKRHNSASSRVLLSSSPSPPPPPPKDDESTPSTKPGSHSSKSSSSSSSSSTPTLTKTPFPQIQPLDIQIDTATPDELRLALRQRNMQLENLASHIQKVTEIHAQEKVQWERDIERRDKEIKRLTSLTRSGSDGYEQAASTPRSLTTPDLDKERSDDSSVHSTRLGTPSSSIRLPIYRHLNAEDSGAESYPTSGAESVRDSGTSGAESGEHLSKPRRAMRKLKLVESFNRSSASARQFALNGGNMPITPKTHHSSSSIYSTSSSGSSPFSSPTSVTFSAAGLTSIPETPSRPGTSNNAPSPPPPSKEQTPKEKKERERKLSNVSAPGRGSSAASPSKQPATSARLTPSEAYARNLKKERPPSIAQILSGNRSGPPPPAPIMGESFGGRSRALLGLVPPKKP